MNAWKAGIGCCGPGMSEKEKASPCRSAMKKHTGALFGVLAFVLLAFLVGQVGAILGIIAFFRTL